MTGIALTRHALTRHALSRRMLLAGALAGAVPAWGQGSGKYIRVVVPSQAGGVTDILVRSMTKHVSEILGKQLIIDNRPGGEGTIGGIEVVHSPKDGSTIFAASTTSMSAVAALRKSPPYDPVKDFESITQLGFYTAYLFCTNELPVSSLGALIAYGRAHPGELKCGTPHATARIACAQLGQLGKFDLIEVPYKGEPATMPDIVSGRIHLTFASPSTLMPLVQTRQLKVIATLMPGRTKIAPHVPTMHESGLPGFINAGWGGVFGAKGFPQDEKQRIGNAFAQAMQQPDVIAFAEQNQFALKSSSPAEMDRFVVEETASFKRIVSDSRIETD